VKIGKQLHFNNAGGDRRLIETDTAGFDMTVAILFKGSCWHEATPPGDDPQVLEHHQHRQWPAIKPVW
jgi:hypothetical protein